ncbi:4090_t:CDS:2 [Diversispora eburnea]|uniref:4090_t:CDS:1 n=1 Tax=Diversispora eburnea TaxID=1213867 RepID=A0A9N8ZU22_9GLOM|nr:4090_t:CDS:2 [Diversispora eburnea]
MSLNAYKSINSDTIQNGILVNDNNNSIIEEKSFEEEKPVNISVISDNLVENNNKITKPPIPPSTSLEPMKSFILLNTHERVTPLDKNSLTCPQCVAPHSVYYVKEVDGESKEIFICLSHDNYGCGWKGYDKPNEDKIHAHIAATIASSSTKVVELGFAEPPEIPLTPDLFPSKIGGLPAWLNPEHILSAEQVSCDVCKKPMVLLIQLYTPEDHPPEAFHRTVYVFCCKKGSCHKISWQKSLKVFRSQLPKDNPYWPSPSDKTTDNNDKKPKNNELSNKFVTEKDKYSKALVPVGDEIYENTKVGVDKAFLKFQKKLERDPDQVLRYARLDYQNENNPPPLWVSDTGKSMPEDISHCLYCNQEKTFEFQESLDWGTILVYSCKDNCHVKDMYYIEEFIWRQDFSDEGVNWKR